MTAKGPKIIQGGYIFEFNKTPRYPWINRTLARQWHAFSTSAPSVDIEVSITCYDSARDYNWPEDLLEPFDRVSRNAQRRFPFRDNGVEPPPPIDSLLRKFAPDNPAMITIRARLKQGTGLVIANTDTGLFCFDPEQKTLCIFTRGMRPTLPLLSRFHKKTAHHKAVLMADITNGMMLALSWLLIHDGGLLLHGAGVRKFGTSILFLGLSDAGKSTVARNCAPEYCYSDDGVIIQQQGNQARMFPSIFTQAKRHLHRPLPPETRVKGLLLLQQSHQNRIRPLDKNLLLNQILLHLIHFFRYFDERTARKAFENACTLVAGLPAFRFEFTKSRSEWSDVWQAVEKRNNMSHRS